MGNLTYTSCVFRSNEYKMSELSLKKHVKWDKKLINKSQGCVCNSRNDSCSRRWIG